MPVSALGFVRSAWLNRYSMSQEGEQGVCHALNTKPCGGLEERRRLDGMKIWQFHGREEARAERVCQL